MCNPEFLNKKPCRVANVHFPGYMIEWKWSGSALTRAGEEQ